MNVTTWEGSWDEKAWTLFPMYVPHKYDYIYWDETPSHLLKGYHPSSK
jgi:hypothetical protein